MDFVIDSYGAVADGKTLNTAAIQAAIDDCARLGGRVVIPAGEYLTGTLRLRSGVELHLSHSARLIASDRLEDYNELDEYEQNAKIVSSEGWGGYHLIICVEQENVAITGTGCIFGNADSFFTECSVDPTFYPWRNGYAGSNDCIRPGQLICFVESKNITLRDFTVENTPCWSCFLHGCEYVSVSGLRIFNPHYHANTDGIDIDACRFVTVSDCIINVGDDAFAIRSSAARLKNKNACCEYVTISNCVVASSSSAFRVGVGQNAIRHVRVSTVAIERAGIGINFYPEWANTSHTPISDVSFSDISATDVGRMIELNVTKGTSVKRINIRDVTAEAMSAIRFTSTCKGAVEGVRFENVQISAIRDIFEKPSRAPEHRGEAFVECEGVCELSLTDCLFRIDEGLSSQWKRPVVFKDCDGIKRLEYEII